ncbi:nucleotidyltransferase family protein [soil metagenome]
MTSATFLPHGGLTGIVLAAGAGTRIGTPKALLSTVAGEPWVARATALLVAAGCDPVLVVLGASADLARELVPSSATVVVADDWAEGMSASLRAGLLAADPLTDAALITLVDLPGLPSTVVERVLAAGAAPDVLAQAVFEGRPGHPVLIGRSHWATVSAQISGDRGARGYLAAHGVTEVECGDLFSGEDVDSR